MTAAVTVADRDAASATRWAISGRVANAAGLLIAWEALARVLSDTLLLAGPVAVSGYLYQNAALLGRALAVTLENAAWGFLLGNLGAVALALLALALPRLRGLVSGLALVVFCLPLVATGPILRVLYGPGPGPQITIAALAVYYTTFIPLMVGLRAAPASWFDLMRIYGRGGVTALVQVRAMAALPYLLAGLQIAAPAAFLGAMIGEFTGAERGMGILTIRAMRGLDVQATWALATLAASVAILAYALLGWIARWLVSDRPEALLAPPPPQTGAAGGAAAALATGLLTVIVALALWWGAMEAFGLNRFFAKRPDDLWRFLFTAPQAEASRAVLFGALGETLRETVPGYAAGLMLGAGLAALLNLWPAAAGAVLPAAIALRSVPIVTTAPLIVLALGRGSAGTMAIVAVMTFFPALVACIHGLRQTPGQVLDLFGSYAAGPLRLLLHARLPAMLPAFFASARMSVPAAFLAVTVAEWLATGRGIGTLMATSASTSNYNMLWASVAALTLVAALAYAAVAAVERAVLMRFAPEQLR